MAEKLKVVHFSVANILGGAAMTAYRIHRALLAENVQSSMAVMYKAKWDDTVHRAAGASLLSRVFLGRSLVECQD